MTGHELAAARAQLADCVGQRITAAEMPDASCVGLRLESGELVLLATIQQRPHDAAPALAVTWHVFVTGEAAQG